METPQQQRRSTIGQFASVLAEAGLGFDVLDLVDSLWLAQFMEPGGVVSAPSQPNVPAVPPGGSAADTGSQADEPTVNLYPDSQPQRERSTEQSETSRPAESSKGVPFSVPAAPALRTRLELARALRPLMRKVPSQKRFDLDEAATVTQIAETAVWLPVVRARPERWLELDFVVEDSKTTAIWERSISELNHLAEYQGAFRSVRTWRLSAENGQVKLFPRWLNSSAKAGAQPGDRMSQRPRSPKELIDPTGRRLIWVVTDCTSSLWREGVIHETLLAWSQVQSVSIFQLFPQALWSRTALRDGHVVRLSALAPGLPSAQLEVEGLPRRLVRRGGVKMATVPVITVEPEMLQRWARVIAGAGDTRTPGRVFDLNFIDKQAERLQSRRDRVGRSVLPASTKPAAERVAFFRSTASKPSRRLANLMAAAPVSLPVIDLLREAFRADFREDVRQSHVAEVLLSGLLRRCDREGDEVCQYEFFGDDSSEPDERVRDILLGDSSITKTRRVLDVLSNSIYRKLGRTPKSFQAMLSEIQTLETELQDVALPFARVGLDVLLRLGGEHAELAQRVKLQFEAVGMSSSQDFPPLTDFDFLRAQFSDVRPFPPSLATESFTLRTLERQSTQSLETFEITVATLIEVGGQWQLERQQRRARRFIETLSLDGSGRGLVARTLSVFRRADSVALEMVAIPGGTFLMGSPDDETERFERESPQHEVTVAPFFMGRYPVTQAQWRLVASMPQVERALEPAPSRFKEAMLPVEQVSWYDAVEFCARLSVHTGREYRLPTEAEWEYACRAGATTAFHFGEMITTEVANYNGSAYADGPKGESRRTTTPVDKFGIANAYGLSDMHGNVSELCQDRWHGNYEGAPVDGSAAWLINNEGASRVYRGGSWLRDPEYCRSACRDYRNPDDRFSSFGFRVSCAAPRALA
ncbi:MAG: formylglycine-generating enzyme family protein [Cyanobacteria bacterium J06555_13]